MDNAPAMGELQTLARLHASVSSALGVVGSAIDWASRPKVVTTALDFPTLVYQWLVKQRNGVEVVIVESPDGLTVPVDALTAAIDDRTALVATSHVYFTTGAIQDVRAVADAAHAKGALCFIDAYQSVGQVPVDVQETRADFLCAGGLKWLLGGPGLVFLYVREDLVTGLQPTVTGWFAHERQFDFDPTRMEWHGDHSPCDPLHTLESPSQWVSVAPGRWRRQATEEVIWSAPWRQSPIPGQSLHCAA